MNSSLKQIAVVSGKGGTGKTTVLASFAALSRNAVLADCDVDAANLHLLLAPKIVRTEDFFGAKVAVRDPDRFEAWLRRLLVHACYREARRVKYRGVVEIHMTVPDAHGAGDIQDLTALRDQLERGFRRLTPEQRAVLVVHHYLGLADAEAAIVLDIAVGTFKSRLNRASAALRAALEADERTPAVARESIA